MLLHVKTSEQIFALFDVTRSDREKEANVKRVEFHQSGEATQSEGFPYDCVFNVHGSILILKLSHPSDGRVRAGVKIIR